MLKRFGVLLLAVLMLAAGFTWAEEPTAAVPVPEETVSPEAAPAEAPAPEETEPEAPAEPKKLIALTFDDGPDKNMTAPTLDMLEKYGVRATFFLLGCKIDEESAPLVERAVGLGCEIGYHGWDHRTMTKVSLEGIQKHIRKFHGAMEKYVHVPVSVKLVRPPGGHSNARSRLAVGGMDMAIIIWDVDSADWKVQKADAINETVQKKVKDGSVILMHDRHQPTPDSLDTLIPALLAQGYEFVTASELLTRNGEEIVPGEEYRCMPPKAAVPTSVD